MIDIFLYNSYYSSLPGAEQRYQVARCKVAYLYFCAKSVKRNSKSQEMGIQANAITADIFVNCGLFILKQMEDTRGHSCVSITVLQ